MWYNARTMLPAEKFPPYIMNGNLVCMQDRLGHGGEDKNPCPFRESDSDSLVLFSHLNWLVIQTHNMTFFYVLLTVHFCIFILVINQLDAQNLFSISLFHACTCFKHHVLIIRGSKLYYTASGIIIPTGV